MAAQKTIRIMIVDDHTVVRGGLKYFLLAFKDMELVGEAASGEEALRLCGQLQPDVVLMDLKMTGGTDGVAATKAIRADYPEVKVIALTSFQEGELVKKAMEAGAIGYLLKDVDIDKLAEAIRAAYAGRPTLAPEAAQALIEVTVGPPQPDFELTDRQKEVLALLVHGLSNVEIAEQLHISLSTARHHVSLILAKLGAANRAEAAALAVQHGLVPK
jgi:NarL family two-component system response regulator LiaR